jgi:hypothetical protein
MTQMMCAASQATLEQLMLEVSAGVPLEQAATLLGISIHAAVHIMQQNEMESRLHNLVSAWTDAQFKLPVGVSPTSSLTAFFDGRNNVADLTARLLHDRPAPATQTRRSGSQVAATSSATNCG